MIIVINRDNLRQATRLVTKRHRFGRSSEKLDTKTEQLELMLDEMAYLGVDVDIFEQEQSSLKTPKSKPSRQKLPEDLLHEDITHDPIDTCPECGDDSF